MHFLYFPFHLTFPWFPLGKSGLVALLLRREAYVSAGLRLAKVGRLLLLLIFASLRVTSSSALCARHNKSGKGERGRVIGSNQP